MAPEELERAIVAPADQAGLVVEPRLLAEMIADVADRPGRAPAPAVRAHRARRARRRPNAHPRRLPADRPGLRRARSTSGAAVRADERAGRDACRQLFLRLVTLGEGTEDTRRRVRRSELATLADAADDGRRHRDVRASPAALVRSRPRHAGADGRDRARSPAPRMGAPARMDRRCPGGLCGSARGSRRGRRNGSMRTEAPTTCCRGSGSRRPRRPAGGDRFGSPRTNASSSTRASPTGMPRDGRADAPRARAHPRAPCPHPPSRAGRRAGGGARPSRLAHRRLREA